MPTVGGEGGRGNGLVPKYKATLVLSIATIISTINQSDVILVNTPNKRNNPPSISVVAIKLAVSSGKANPTFKTLPTPCFRKKNFKIPSKKNPLPPIKQSTNIEDFPFAGG